MVGVKTFLGELISLASAGKNIQRKLCQGRENAVGVKAPRENV